MSVGGRNSRNDMINRFSALIVLNRVLTCLKLFAHWWGLATSCIDGNDFELGEGAWGQFTRIDYDFGIINFMKFKF